MMYILSALFGGVGDVGDPAQPRVGAAAFVLRPPIGTRTIRLTYSTMILKPASAPQAAGASIPFPTGKGAGTGICNSSMNLCAAPLKTESRNNRSPSHETIPNT